MPCHAEQVVAFIGRQPQSAGQRGEHLGAGLRAAPLLQAGVVVGRHGREVRDLLSTQAGRAATGSGDQTDVRRLQAVAPMHQEVSESITIHSHSMGAPPRLNQGAAIP